MSVQTAAHVWVPQLSSEKHDTSLITGDTVDYKKIRISNTGNVSGLMIFNLQTFCDVDFHNFPADVHTCCAQLEPTFFDNIINFKIADPSYKIDTRFIKNTGYNIDRVLMQTFTTPESAAYQFCVHITRSNTTLHVELAVPMAICAILILFAPLFGSLKTQLHVKLFALLLQYLCLQFLANKMTYLGNGSTPRIFRFYEFTIVMNLVSLLLTVFVAAANRADRTLPPAQSLMNFSMLINKFCFCFSIVDEIDDSHSGTSPGEEKKYARDWRSIFSAVHSILMTLVVIVYLIGVSIIYT